MTSNNRADFVYLGGKSRRYLDVTTGQTISRRQYDQLFRLGPRGLSSYEALAKERAHAGYAPLARTNERFYRVVERVLRTGVSSSQAAKSEHMNLETLRRYDRDRGLLHYNRRTKRGEVHAAGRVSFFDANGALHKAIPFDHKEIRTLSAYGQAVKAAKRGRTAALASFADMRVKDVLGTQYRLLTNINAYLRLEQIYGDMDPLDFFQSGDVVVAPPVPAAA
jgi:hypothetical protein